MLLTLLTLFLLLFFVVGMAAFICRVHKNALGRLWQSLICSWPAGAKFHCRLELIPLCRMCGKITTTLWWQVTALRVAAVECVRLFVCVCVCLWELRWGKVSCHVDEVIRLAASEAWVLGRVSVRGSGLVSHCTFSCSVISCWWAKSPKTYNGANFSSW